MDPLFFATGPGLREQRLINTAAPETPKEPVQPQAPNAVPGVDAMSLDGKPPGTLAMLANEQGAQHIQNAAVVQARHEHFALHNEEQLMHIAVEGGDIRPEDYIKQRNKFLEPQGVHLSGTAGQLKLSPMSRFGENPQLAQMRQQLAILDRQIANASSQFEKMDRGQRIQGMRLNGIRYKNLSGGRAMRSQIEAGRVQGQGQELASLYQQRDNLQREINRLQFQPYNPTAAGGPQMANGVPYGVPGMPGYPGGAGGVEGGPQPEVLTEAKRASIEKMIDKYNEAKTDNEREKIEGGMRLVGVDVGATNMETKDIVMCEPGLAQTINMIIGVVQIFGALMDKDKSKNTKEPAKTDAKPEAGDKPMTPEEKAKKIKDMEKTIEDSKKEEDKLMKDVNKKTERVNDPRFEEEDHTKAKKEIDEGTKKISEMQDERMKMEDELKELKDGGKDDKKEGKEEEKTELDPVKLKEKFDASVDKLAAEMKADLPAFLEQAGVDVSELPADQRGKLLEGMPDAVVSFLKASVTVEKSSDNSKVRFNFDMTVCRDTAIKEIEKISDKKFDQATKDGMFDNESMNDLRKSLTETYFDGENDENVIRSQWLDAKGAKEFIEGK